MENYLLNGAESYYSLTTIESMCRGKADKIARMVETFINTMPAAINEIQESFTKRNITTLKEIVHRIKPTLAFYNITSLEPVVKYIEQTEDFSGSFAGIDAMVEQIVTVVNFVVTDLKKKYL